MLGYRRRRFNSLVNKIFDLVFQPHGDKDDKAAHSSGDAQLRQPTAGQDATPRPLAMCGPVLVSRRSESLEAVARLDPDCGPPVEVLALEQPRMNPVIAAAAARW